MNGKLDGSFNYIGYCGSAKSYHLSFLSTQLIADQYHKAASAIINPRKKLLLIKHAMVIAILNHIQADASTRVGKPQSPIFTHCG
jgi:hypothetical protein